MDLGIEYEQVTTDTPLELVLFDLLKASNPPGPPARPTSARRAGEVLVELSHPLYALGLLAIAGPILFHLIQRRPRGEVPFSSLMFLTPTPPRLTRRSRLDNLLLLFLRRSAAHLARPGVRAPFWRQAANLDFGNVERRRVAVVIDTSASMRRGDLWRQAKQRAEEAIAACRPADELALFAFDGSSRPLLSFHESAALGPGRRQAVAQAQVERLEPTWGGTQLDQALIDAVAAIEDVADTSEKAGRMPRRIVLISDLQQGSQLEAARRVRVALGRGTRAEDRGRPGLQRQPARLGRRQRARAVERKPTSPRPAGGGDERARVQPREIPGGPGR